MTFEDRIRTDVTRKTDVSLTADDWQMFTASMDCSEAARRINAAIAAAVDAGGDRRDVRKAAHREMEAQAGFGAADSEPLQVLEEVLDGIFAVPDHAGAGLSAKTGRDAGWA